MPSGAAVKIPLESGQTLDVGVLSTGSIEPVNPPPRIIKKSGILNKGDLNKLYSCSESGVVKFTYNIDKSEYLRYSSLQWKDSNEDAWVEAARRVAAETAAAETARLAAETAAAETARLAAETAAETAETARVAAAETARVAAAGKARLVEGIVDPVVTEAKVNLSSESLPSGLENARQGRTVSTSVISPEDKKAMLLNLKKLLDKVFPNETTTSSVPPASCTDVLLIEQGSLKWLEAVVVKQSQKPSSIDSSDSSDSNDAAEKATILQELWDVLPFNELELVNVYDLVRKSDFFTTLHNEQSFVQIIREFSRISKANYEFSRKTISGKENSFHRLEVVKNGSKWVLNIDIDVSEEKITQMGEDSDTFNDIVIQTFSFQNNNKVLTSSDESYDNLPTNVLTSLQVLRALTDISASVTTIPFGIEHIEQKNLLERGKLNQDKISALADFFGDNWYIEKRPSRIFTRESNYFGLKLVGDEATGIYIGINIHWGFLSTLVRCEIFWIPSKYLLQIFGNSGIYKKDDTLDMERIYDEFVSNQKKDIFDKVTEGLNTYMTKHLIPYTSSSTGGKKQHKRSRKVPKKNLTRQTRKH